MSRRSRQKRRIAHEAERRFISTRKANKDANLRREIALLNATTELLFYGDTIIQPRDDAILTATECSKSGPNRQHRVFFVDGSHGPRVKEEARQGEPGTGKRKGKCNGAGVAYIPDGVAQAWEQRWFALPKGGSYFISELGGIAEGLAIAVGEILRQNIPNGGGALTKPKVIIFTDCQNALRRLEKLRTAVVSRQGLLNNPILRKLITRSQYIRGLGHDVEVRWVPGHSWIEGNEHAHAAARGAATTIGLGIYLDEGLRLIESAEHAAGHVEEHVEKHN